MRRSADADFMSQMMGASPRSVGLVSAASAETADSDGAAPPDIAGGDGAAAGCKRGRDDGQNSAPPTPSTTARKQHAS